MLASLVTCGWSGGSHAYTMPGVTCLLSPHRWQLLTTVKAAHKIVLANGETASLHVCSVMSDRNQIMGQWLTLTSSLHEVVPAFQAIYK